MVKINHLYLINLCICIYLTYVFILCSSTNLADLDNTIIKYLHQAEIDSVILQQKIYLYYEQLQALQRKVKCNDTDAVNKVKKIMNNGGPKYFNYTVNTNLLKKNEWSSFEILVLDDIISATKNVWNKSIVYMARLNNNVSFGLQFDSFEQILEKTVMNTNSHDLKVQSVVIIHFIAMVKKKKA